jgi:hypothetical protein
MLDHDQSLARAGALGGFLMIAAGIWSCQDHVTTGALSPALPGVVNPSADPVLVGAGDIARCSYDGDEITAALLDAIPGTVIAVGDNAYEIDATPARVQSAYTDCYASSWGRHKARTRPVPGNHEYLAPGAPQYYAYYGELAGPAGRGYYSYDLGTWHVIALNSNIAADPSSEQMRWLRADLAANRRTCTVAYWHHPVFSSGFHGNNPYMAEIWRVLDSADVDLAIVAHDHNYERFAPQDYAGRADPNGIRQIVVGTGGGDLRPFGVVRANSEVRNSDTYGVLKLTLRSGRYHWEFVAQAGATFTDVGSAKCV